MRLPLYEILLKDSSGNEVRSKLLPGSALTEEDSSADMADGTAAQTSKVATFTARMVLDTTHLDQIADWVGNQTPVDVVGVGFTHVMVWQDVPVVILDDAPENGAGVLSLRIQKAYT